MKGDRVEAVYTEALAIAVTPAPKGEAAKKQGATGSWLSGLFQQEVMKLRYMFVLGLWCLTATGVSAADAEKAKKQAEIQKMAHAALPDFYKAQASLKAEVEKAPGYAVFSTFGLSFLIGGSGGKGLVHDNKTGKDTYMHQAQASVGVQAGIAESRTLIVFKSAGAMNKFVDSGWEVGAGGGAGAAVEGKGAGGAAGGTFTSETSIYTLTHTGLQAGIAAPAPSFGRTRT